MKKRINVLGIALLLMTMLGLVSCHKKEEITIPANHLWFPIEACVQELKVTANCKWSVDIDDDADWYTIDPMSGKNDDVINVTVKALGDAAPRTSSFTITSAKGKAQLQVRVSQNTDEPAEMKSITNKVFGGATIVHWNVDYFGEVVKETYERRDFNPYDTTSGYIMYFLEDSIGVQQDNHGDSTIFYQFKYDYNPNTRIIYFDFVTVGDTTETYNASVLAATEELFRFQHEYNRMQWELADMRQIGTINTNQKADIRQKAVKRKGKGPVFQF